MIFKDETRQGLLDYGFANKYAYTGEVDKEGKACGFGTAVKMDARVDKTKKYTGTFLNDKLHGISKIF